MTIILYILSVLLMIALPLALAIGLRRRFFVPWWLFCLGMATFIGSQLYHLPLNNWLSDLGLIGEVSPQSPALLQTSLVLGLSAGFSETLARAAGYWFLFRRRAAQRWQDAVMVGLGHGGIEAMVIGAIFTAASVTSLWVLRDTDLSTLDLSAAQFEVLSRQMVLFFSSPWLALAPLLERAIALVLHVTLSVLVWLAFKRRNLLYGLLAVLYHGLFDATAVYAAQFIENAWLLEAMLAVMALPGAVWMLSLRPSKEARARRRLPAVSTELALFGTAVAKELRQQWRTRRMLVVGAVFALFGLVSPLIARFTPELLSTIEGAEQFAELVPTPTTADALTQYVKNLTQFGFIIAILLGMGAVAGEKEKGTAALILSKPLPRWAFILSKFVAQALVYLLGFAVASLGAYYYTLILFDPLQLGPFLLGNVLLLLWLLTFTAVTLLSSTLAGATGAAAGLALAGSVLLFVAGSLPRVGVLAPAGLVAWASQLGLESAVSANGGALAASMVLIVVCLITAVAAFESQEL